MSWVWYDVRGRESWDRFDGARVGQARSAMSRVAPLQYPPVKLSFNRTAGATQSDLGCLASTSREAPGMHGPQSLATKAEEPGFSRACFFFFF